MRIVFLIAFTLGSIVFWTGGATARAADDDQVRPIFITQPTPSASNAPAPSRLLAASLGAFKASADAAEPNPETVPRAKDFALAGQSSRQYGPVRASVYQTADESTAFSLITSVRPVDASPLDVGDEGWKGADATAFRVAEYGVVLEGGTPASREAMAKSLVKSIGARRAPAPLTRFLPEGERIAGTEHYAPSFDLLRRWRADLAEDIFQLAFGGADGVVVDYRQGNGDPVHLLLIEYQTPQLAGAAERRVEAFYAALSPEARQSRFFKREGNFLIEATGVTDTASARAVVDAIKYDYSIKMLKDDTAAAMQFAEETRKAALVFINSFTIVGMALMMAMAVGLVVGAVIFRRRRRAAANIFSDAGGMVHLDLGPQRLTPARSIGFLSSGSPEN